MFNRDIFWFLLIVFNRFYCILPIYYPTSQTSLVSFSRYSRHQACNLSWLMWAHLKNHWNQKMSSNLVLLLLCTFFCIPLSVVCHLLKDILYTSNYLWSFSKMSDWLDWNPQSITQFCSSSFQYLTCDLWSPFKLLWWCLQRYFSRECRRGCYLWYLTNEPL